MNRWRRFALMSFVFVVAVIGAACGGSGSSGSSFSKIDTDATVRDLESFIPSGLKQNKVYDVSELPGAIAAYMVYFTPAGSEPIQYELRMYPDHASAIDDGISYADEVTGEDALLRSVDVRWEEGTKDRRGGGAFRGQLTPLYGDYAVIGNVIVLCEGRSSEQALERCEALLLAAGIGG
ncbi:MAG TPA: hypothetical protein EYQ61_07495 [Dehalococcoidia bacterium]|nr:hypothetical protein [Dehalococcoidia bacterium]